MLVRDVLKSFHNATNTFSLVYEPNIHLVIVECIKVVHAINEELDVSEIKVVLDSMKVKWFSYFVEFPYIFGVACILDQALKLDGLSNLLNFYYQCLGVSYDVGSYVLKCRHLLEKLHDHYVSIYDPDFVPTFRHANTVRFDSLITNILKKQKTIVFGSACAGVDDYLSYQFETGSDFHILKWWKLKENQFPILTRIASDVLAISALIIASESAFSAGRRVLDEKRSRLSPQSIEICVCKKD